MLMHEDPLLYPLLILFILSVVCAVFLFFYGLSWFLSSLMNSPFTEQEIETLDKIKNHRYWDRKVNKDNR